MSREVAGWGGGGRPGERSGLRIRSRRQLGEIEVDSENVNCDDPFPPCAHFQPSESRSILSSDELYTSFRRVCMAVGPIFFFFFFGGGGGGGGELEITTNQELILQVI